MDENVTNLRDPDAGVVSFGVPISGYTAVVEGREIPRLMVKERGPSLITICLDRRWEIDVPREHSGSICWMIANALADPGCWTIGRSWPPLWSRRRRSSG